MKEELQRKNMEARKFKTNIPAPKKRQPKKIETHDPRFFDLKKYGENMLVGGSGVVKPTFQPFRETPKEDGEIQRIMSSHVEIRETRKGKQPEWVKKKYGCNETAG